MSRSASSLLRAGVILPKAYNATLAKTRAQKSKMAEFHAKGKDEGAGKKRGELRSLEINNPKRQGTGSPEHASGKPSRGGQARGSDVPGRNAIDKGNSKMFPAGGSAKGKGGTPGTPARAKGGVTQSGPMYGGGGRSTQ